MNSYVKPIIDAKGLVSERSCVPLRLKNCDPGYKVNDEKNGCIDIDECLVISCPYLSTCNNLPGSYACPCNTGFKPSGTGLISNTTSSCEDRKECEEAKTDNIKLCDGVKTHKKCKNTYGSYECVCKNGFEPFTDQAGEIACRDIDECVVDKYNSNRECKSSMGSYSTCKNSIGGFECECINGYKVNADGICTDIDECTALTSGEFFEILSVIHWRQ